MKLNNSQFSILKKNRREIEYLKESYEKKNEVKRNTESKEI